MRQSVPLTIVALLACAFWAAAEDAATQPACPQQAQAAAHGDDFKAKLKQADANQDGQVTFEEASGAFPGVTQEQFAKYDRNGDGIVTRADAPAAPQGQHKGRRALLAKADADGNKQVTYEELVAVAPKMTQERFKQLDQNGDGVLTSADRPAHPKDGHLGGAQSGPKAGKPDRMAMLQKADADNNGQVTFEELQAAKPDIPRERFDKMDRNHDGVLSPADSPAEVPGDTPAGPQGGPKADKLAMFKKADVNSDHQVTFEELQAVAPNFTRERFDHADQNRDGVLTPEDHVGRGNGPAEKGKGLAEKIQKADANGDGKTTYEEVTSAKPGFPREAFDKLDTDKDGALSKEDAPATR